MAIPDGYSLQTTKYGSYVGPGSQFRVVAQVYAKDNGTGYDLYLRRYVQVTVPSGGSGFRGTTLTLGWSPGSVSISTAGNYAVYDYEWKTTNKGNAIAYGESEPVQASDAKAYYTSGSGVTYTSSVGFTYTVTKPTYTVAFNANGGSGAPSSQTKTYGVTLTLSSTTPTRSGYTFVGWGTSSTSTSASYSAGGSYTANAAITLYAVWKKTITITYNANSGSGAPSSQSATVYNATTSYTFTLSSTKPTRTGYTFLGWSTSSSATSASYSAGGSVTLSSSTTLYAVWKIITYTVTYNANGGTGAPSSQTKTYGVALTLSALEPTYAGYFFKGWNTAADGSGTSYSIGGTYTANAAVTLYAQWQVATLIGVTFTYPGDYIISNDSSGNAVLNNISIPFTLSVTDDNSEFNFIYKVYYSYNNKLVGGTQYTVNSGTTSGTITLSSSDIKSYLVSSENISSIDIFIQAYTGEISDDTLSKYNYSIAIDSYSKPAVNSLISYRNSDDSVYVKTIVSYPISYDTSNCLPILYFNDTELDVSPTSTIDDEDNTDKVENLVTYVYNLSSFEVDGSGTLKIYYTDGLFEASSTRLLAASANEQIIRIYRSGIVKAFEFIESDNTDISFSRSGAVTVYELNEV